MAGEQDARARVIAEQGRQSKVVARLHPTDFEDRASRYLLLDCGHWCKWQGPDRAPTVGSAMPCPKCFAIKVMQSEALQTAEEFLDKMAHSGEHVHEQDELARLLTLTADTARAQGRQEGIAEAIRDRLWVDRRARATSGDTP